VGGHRDRPQGRHVHPAVSRLPNDTKVRSPSQRHDDFGHANDPHGEHDFGAFDTDGTRVFFKVDDFDSTLTMHSPDPSDPKVTKQVITIMLAEAY
jgi:hypothetical protein